MMVIKSYMDEVKILQSGSYYMTPFHPNHILEILPILHKETEKELANQESEEPNADTRPN